MARDVILSAFRYIFPAGMEIGIPHPTCTDSAREQSGRNAGIWNYSKNGAPLQMTNKKTAGSSIDKRLCNENQDYN